MTDPKVDCSSLPTYTAHLVPCKVRYTGATEEFKDNFQMDLSHGESLKKVDRLREEIDKFNEFIELNDIVHS